MIPISSKDIVRHIPSRCDQSDPKSPVYLLSAPTIAGKARFDREMLANGCKFHSDEELLIKLREGVNTVIQPEQRLEIIEAIDLYQLYKKEKKDIPPELAAEIINLERTISNAYTPYAELMADRVFYLNMYPLLLTRLFLKGWENIDAKFTKTGDQVSEESMNEIKVPDLYEIGVKIMGLMNPTGNQEKN